MSLNSVNTNVGALVALQSLNRTNSELGEVQKRVSTGFRVADAQDDGAAFAVAQGLRANIKGYESVNERLSQAKGLLSVTSAALSTISDSAGDIKAVLVKLSDANLGTADRTRYEADYNALTADITRSYTGASFNGTNILLSAAAATTNVVANIAGGNIQIAKQDIQAALTTLGATAPSGAAAAITALGKIDTFQGTVGTALAAVGASQRTVINQETFTTALNDATTSGLGAIVDADLAKESAKLQALQIRQQLGTQSLSIANQAPSSLISLFR